MKIFDENSSNINILIEESISNIKSLMETNTIIGYSVIAPDGTIIIPISKVSVGFIVGGGEYSDKSSRKVAKHYPMAGGSGGGMSVSPVGFLIESHGNYKFIDIENKTAYQTFLNLFNTIVDKLGEKKEWKKYSFV